MVYLLSSDPSGVLDLGDVQCKSAAKYFLIKIYLKNTIKQQKWNETAKADMVYICLLTGLVQM